MSTAVGRLDRPRGEWGWLMTKSYWNIDENFQAIRTGTKEELIPGALRVQGSRAGTELAHMTEGLLRKVAGTTSRPG